MSNPGLGKVHTEPGVPNPVFCQDFKTSTDKVINQNDRRYNRGALRPVIWCEVYIGYVTTFLCFPT
jgi:hypothetical protein